MIAKVHEAQLDSWLPLQLYFDRRLHIDTLIYNRPDNVVVLCLIRTSVCRPTAAVALPSQKVKCLTSSWVVE